MKTVIDVARGKLLLTGASGRIGSILRKELADEYELVLFNRSPVENLGPNECFIPGDLTDREAVERAARGTDAVVHMAAVSTEESFREKLWPTNILGAYNVFEAARLAGVLRVVYASTHHVVGRYPPGEVLDETAVWRPDSMYAVTKCFGEAMARYYAERQAFSVVCLRIGSFQQRPRDERQLATWISHRDMVQLVRRSIEAPDVQFEVVYGVSGNRRSWWSIKRAQEALGYHPEDDSEVYASELSEEPDSVWSARVKYQGGRMAETDIKP